MKLADWAKKEGVNYLTAYRWFKAGKLPPGVEGYQTDTGTIIIKEENMSRALNKTDNGLTRYPNVFSMFDEMSKFSNVFDQYWTLPKALPTPLVSNKFKILNEDNQYVMVGEVPGFTKDEIKISIKDNVLTVSGRHEVKEKDRYFTQSSSEFEYHYTLPHDSHTEKIHAEQKNGVISIFVPKAASSKSINVPIKQLE